MTTSTEDRLPEEPSGNEPCEGGQDEQGPEMTTQEAMELLQALDLEEEEDDHTEDSTRTLEIQRCEDEGFELVRDDEGSQHGMPEKAYELADGAVIGLQIQGRSDSPNPQFDVGEYYLEDLLHGLNPADAVERMLVTEMAWLHRQAGNLAKRSARASDQRGMRGAAEAMVRTVTALRRHAESFRQMQCPPVPQIHGDGNQINVAAQQVVACGTVEQQAALLEALDGLTEQLRSKLGADNTDRAGPSEAS